MIKVNQVGYLPRIPKVALVTAASPVTDFTSSSASSGTGTIEQTRGSPRNRATAEARAAAEAAGILPLDYMLAVMRDANAEPKRRDAMAIAAAPYLHPKLSTVEPPSDVETSDITNMHVTCVLEKKHIIVARL
jgi:hypothetical protein